MTSKQLDDLDNYITGTSSNIDHLRAKRGFGFSPCDVAPTFSAAMLRGRWT